jgi:hypothetical protein
VKDAKSNVLTAAGDAARNFVYYDRKEDESLSVSALDWLVSSGEVTIAEIVSAFEANLREWGGLKDKA